MRLALGAFMVLPLALTGIVSCGSNPVEEQSYAYATIEDSEFYLNRVSLGDDEETVVAELGKAPERRSIDGNHELLGYPGLHLLISGNQLVNARCTAGCITPQGIRSGSDRAALVERYGEGRSNGAGDFEIINYPVVGLPQMLLFTLQDNQVVEIELWQASGD